MEFTNHFCATDLFKRIFEVTLGFYSYLLVFFQFMLMVKSDFMDQPFGLLVKEI